MIKTCQNCRIKFSIEPEDIKFYEKIGVPTPTFCPECRMIRRFAFRNQKNIYKRKCDASGKDIFSVFSPEKPVKIYEAHIWNSDNWDPMDYAQDYNFTQSFFKQFKSFLNKVPLPSRSVTNLVNSDYSANAGDLKNCYLVFEAACSENCAYDVEIYYSKDCYDNYSISKCELCYEVFMSSGCYKSFLSSYCTECQSVIFCHNCVNCSDCFGCVNLKHKQYHIFNKSYSKKDYFKKLEKFNLGTYENVSELKEKTDEFRLACPVKFMHGSHNVDVSGEYIYDCKNIKDSYMVDDSEDLRFCQFLGMRPGAKDCYDYSIWGEKASLVYETISAGNGMNRIKFSFGPDRGCRDLEYCVECFNCSNLFACVGLRHKQYCILNKQYTKKEYEQMIPKIKKHMNEMPYTDKKGRLYKYGEFFPPELSPFGYNETIANEYFPLTKQQAIKQGFNWYDKPKSEYKPTIKAKDLPDNIKDVDNSILKEVIECDSNNCAGSGVFRIIPQELKFYKKMNLPLPRFCPDCRHRERIKQRNPLKLWKRKCMNKGCNNTFQTTYAPERKEIVYCERCYNKEVA